MSALRERTIEINAEYWAARQFGSERVAVTQLAHALARAEMELRKLAVAAVEGDEAGTEGETT